MKQFKIIFTIAWIIVTTVSSILFAFEISSLNVWSICTPNFTTKSLNCSNRGITSISENTFNSYWTFLTLDLSSNNISLLNDNVFNWLNLLTELNINSNTILYISSGAFFGLDSLRSLFLADNDIPIISSGVFSSLPLLVHLNLNANNIMQIYPDSFSGLGSLYTLELSYNLLSSLGSNLFLHNGNLDNLTLNNNSIYNMSNSTLNWLNELSSINLDQNCARPVKIISYNGASDTITQYNCWVIYNVLSVWYNSILSNNASYSIVGGTYVGYYPISFHPNISNIIHTSTKMKYNESPDASKDNYFDFDSCSVLYDGYTELSQNSTPYNSILFWPQLFKTWNSNGLDGLVSIIRFGNPTGSLELSKSATVTMPAPWKSSGDLVNIYYSNVPTVYWLETNPWTLQQGNVVIQEIWGKPYAIFETSHASRFAIANWISIWGDFLYQYQHISGENTVPVYILNPWTYKLKMSLNNQTSNSQYLRKIPSYNSFFAMLRWTQKTIEPQQSEELIELNMKVFKDIEL